MYNKWREFLLEKDNKPKIPMDVIDFLINTYDPKPNSLKRGYFNFQEFNDQELENSVAVYIASSQTILINDEKSIGKFKPVIEVILHEIKHHIQHLDWENSIQYRMRLSKGYKLPNKDIKDIDWLEVTIFWGQLYPYNERPHEIEAEKFAEQHLDEAIKLILNREEILKRKKKVGNM